jgi:hypothetical protein
MITDLIRRYIAGPIAAGIRGAQRLVKFEPVVVAGLAVEALILFQAQLNEGVTLEHALTAVIVAIGTRLVRQNVWPDAKVDSDGVAYVELEAPITGVRD